MQENELKFRLFGPPYAECPIKSVPLVSLLVSLSGSELENGSKDFLAFLHEVGAL